MLRQLAKVKLVHSPLNVLYHNVQMYLIALFLTNYKPTDRCMWLEYFDLCFNLLGNILQEAYFAI